MSPTQQERTELTTTSLVAAGRELFAADGYAATSLDAVVERAGLTKGALYHHFAGKRELFAAVFEAEQRRLNEVVAVAYTGIDDPWEAFEAGCSEEQALDTVLPWLSRERMMELAAGAVELYCWDRMGSDN